MRSGNNPDILVHDEKFVGVNLSADFCAEHEQGLGDLRRSLFCGEKTRETAGISWRIIGKVEPDKNYFHIEGKKNSMIVFAPYLGYSEESIERMKNWDGVDKGDSSFRELLLGKDDDVAAAWSNSDFGIMVNNKHKKDLQDLDHAIKNKNAAIWFGGGEAIFSRAAFCIGIVDRLPEEFIKDLKDYDLDKYKLIDASNATGIVKRIDEANLAYSKKWHEDNPNSRSICYPAKPCGYHACSPAWKHDNWDDKNRPTKYDVVYLVNPQDQRNINYGWFTVEELELWLKGKGPIPKTDKQKEC